MKTNQFKLTIQQIIDSGHKAEQAPHVLALCQHLDCSPDAVSLERHDCYGLPVYSADGGEYAISADGRGHFLSSYDGEENEETVEMPEGDSLTLYIYRTN